MQAANGDTDSREKTSERPRSKEHARRGGGEQTNSDRRNERDAQKYDGVIPELDTPGAAVEIEIMRQHDAFEDRQAHAHELSPARLPRIPAGALLLLPPGQAR